MTEVAMGEVKVVFTPSGLNGMVKPGTTVLAAARQLGVDLDSVCGGRGICGRCQIVPSTGEFAKWAINSSAESVSEWGSVEADYRGKRAIGPDHRLGCAVEIRHDAVFDVPAESQIHKQVVRKSVNLEGLIVDPAFTLHYLELETAGDFSTAEEAAAAVASKLETDWAIANAEVAEQSLRAVAAASKTNSLTVAIRRSGPGLLNPDSPNLGTSNPDTSNPATSTRPTIVAAWPGFVDRVAGVAVDIGSTTVAGHLCDLSSGEVLASAGRMNPQIRFGEDLMSRVSFVMMNPGGDVELTEAIRTALDELVGELVAETEADIDRSKILDLVLVGNPVMHHLALGYDPVPLGQAPFELYTDKSVHGPASDVGVEAEFASMYFAPCIAGHVGADTAAAILSEQPHQDKQIQLLVDVGTNAEIVLGNNQHLFAASSPTGPAFEGAQISSGQRATAGAIERVRIDRETLEPRFKVIGSDCWSDEPEFEAETAKSGVTGICGSGIIEVMSEMFLSSLINSDGVIDGAKAEKTPRIVPDERTFSYALTDDIHITQADVRAIQLAKAALRAGIDLLLEHLESHSGLAGVDEVRLAGAFGAHIDPVHAMVLGLIPDCEVDRVSSVGNSAGSGAVRALLSQTSRAELEATVASVTKIETAIEPRFQELFVAALAFPHLDAPNPHLASQIDLPEKSAAGQPGRPRRRRRRTQQS